MKYRFSELADIPKLQELMGSLYWLTDIAIGIIESDGTFLFCAGWYGACSASSRKACDCQDYIAQHLDPVSYTCRRCPTGMLHYACPIVVEGEHLASVYIGQFFTEPPDRGSVALEAANRGLDPAEYLKVLEKVAVIPPMRLTLLLKYLKDLADMLADIGLQRRRQMDALEILRLNEERLQYLSSHDPLTGLNNRSCFEEKMAAMDENPSLPTAIMVLDLDCLKKINDSQGHSAGDALLRSAAEILRECAPPEATLARIGGDEFSMLLPLTDAGTAAAIRLQILEKTRIFNELNEYLPVEISIGYAVADCFPFDMRELFKAADANMYLDKVVREQKHGGRENIARRNGDNG